MAHPSERRWEEVAQVIQNVSASVLETLNRAEEHYQELLVDYVWAGATDQKFADLLFEASPASAEQRDQVTDLRLALLAAHELFQAMNNVATSQDDRAQKLRTMS